MYKYYIVYIIFLHITDGYWKFYKLATFTPIYVEFCKNHRLCVRNILTTKNEKYLLFSSCFLIYDILKRNTTCQIMKYFQKQIQTKL